jgi:nucleoid-associated protein YgaU
MLRGRLRPAWQARLKDRNMAETLKSRGGIIALGALALLAIGGLIYLSARPDVSPTPPVPPPAPEAAATVAAPQFDVVRVDSSGNTVIAGRAAPGATVTIKRGTDVLGTATADASGAFVFLPDKPLPPGAQQLTLSETLSNGSTVAGQVSASVDVPATPSGPSLSVLSGPNGSQVQSGQGPQPGTLGMGSVDYDANGHAIFSGTAPAGALVTLSLDGRKLGDVVAGTNGRWQFTGKVPDASGTFSLTATAADGSALPAVTAPFALETLPTALADGHVVIAPGQNLWLIARHVYGRGTLYTLIYNANSGQIRDPNLIFPGQAFAVPRQ